MKICKRICIDNIINNILFFYILSLYLFTYIEKFNIISNAIAAILVITIWMKCLYIKRKLIFNNFLFIYILFIIICTMSFFVAVDKNMVLSKVGTLILLFIVMFSLINYIDNFEKLRKFLISFVYSGFIASLYILFTSDFSNITRFGSELGNVNAVGMMIGISAIFCFYLFLEEKRFIYFVLLLTMLPIILLTGSRKSVLFFLMNLIIILYLRNRDSLSKKLKFFFIGGILFFLVLFLVFKIPLFYKIIGYRIENVFSFLSGKKVNEGSIYERFYMIEVGLKMIKDRPILGYGIDNYRFYYSRVPSGRETYSHNNFIELIVGTGIFGFLFYYLIHFIILRSLFKASICTKEKMICYTFISIIISYIILSMALIYYYDKHFNLLLAVGSIVNRVIYNDLKTEQREEILC